MYLKILPPFDLVYPDFAFDELVNISDYNGSLDIHQSERGYRIPFGRIRYVREKDASRKSGVTHPLKVPVHAPDADPGLTKKWLSCSIAWKLRSSDFEHECKTRDSEAVRTYGYVQR